MKWTLDCMDQDGNYQPIVEADSEEELAKLAAGHARICGGEAHRVTAWYYAERADHFPGGSLAEPETADRPSGRAEP